MWFQVHPPSFRTSVTRHERKRVTCHESSHESVACHAPRGGGGGNRKANLKWGGFTGHGNTAAINVGVEVGVGAKETSQEESTEEESRKEARGAEQLEEPSKSRKEPTGAEQLTREEWQEEQVYTQPCTLSLARSC